MFLASTSLKSLNKLVVGVIASLAAGAASAGTNATYNAGLGFAATSSVFGTGDPLGGFGTQNLLQTSWNNSGVLGGITPLRASYDFIGQTGTYCGIRNPFNDSCIQEFPSYGTVTNTVDLGKAGMALPFSTNGRASLDLSYKATPGAATIAYPYQSAIKVTQVGSSVYQVSTSAALDAGKVSINSFTGLPQASVDLNYAINAQLGSFEVCAGGCFTAGGGLVSASGPKTTNLLNFNADGKGKLIIPGVVNLDPHGPNGDLTYNKNGITAKLNIPSLDISKQGAQSDGSVIGNVKTTLGTIGYDICSLIPYCFNKSDSVHGDLGSGFSYSASYNAAAVSLVAGVAFGLDQTAKFTANAINGVMNFANSIGLIKKDANGAQTVEATKSISFQPGQSFLIDTGSSKDVKVNTSYSLAGTLHDRVDLTMDASLHEALLQAAAKLSAGYDLNVLGIQIKDSQSYNFSLGPVLQATQLFPLGFVNLIDSDIAISSAVDGLAFDLVSNCTPSDLVVNHLGGDTGIGSLANAIECANVTPNSLITLTGGLGTIKFGDGLPSVNGDVTFFNGGDELVGFDRFNVVPEPETYAIFAAGLAAIMFLRQRKLS